MRERFRNAFFTWGWLLPAALPLAQVTGRGVVTVLGLFYYGLAMISLYGQRVEVDRKVFALYGLLLIAFLLSVVNAEEMLKSFREWSKFMVYSSAGLWTLVTLQLAPPAAIDRLIIAFGVCAVIVLVILYLLLAVQIRDPSFEPTLHMREDNLPLLIPFLLYLVQYRTRFKLRHGVAVLFLCAVGAYVILSQGRAALVGLMVALIGYGYWVIGWRMRTLLGLGASLLVLAILLSGDRFLRGAESWFFLIGSQFFCGAGEHVFRADNLISALDALSSGRTVLWRQALTSFLDNPLMGIGIGGTSNGVFTHVFPDGRSITLNLDHLHNFLFDVFRHTGLVGLSTLLVWLGYLLRRGFRAYKRADMHYRPQAGVLLAASVAILINALLSYSYRSEQFAIYLFLFLAALAHLDQKSAPAA